MRFAVSAAAPADLQWLHERARCYPSVAMRAIKATDSTGRIRGMVGYDAWCPGSCQAHMAVETPAAWRALIPSVFEYPFIEAKVDLLIGVIPENNRRSCRMTRRLGFRERHRIRDGWEHGIDLILFELRIDECRFLSGIPRRTQGRPWYYPWSPLL